ncbi:CHAT domain-containing protein [Microbacterium sp. NPDC091676]|uniref:CHAT domain-containing protein n=1 Tax=Microbacterium sp. NPDC091676 TaxID=3364212 RepID=UPI0037F5662A
MTHRDKPVLFWFTPLEARLLGVDPERDSARAVLEGARSDMYMWMLMPGAWPKRAHGETPAWFRDVVTVDGARLWRSSSGYVATLSVVVETDRDERSILRWSYAPTLAARFPDEASVELFIVLDPDDDPAYLPFSFDYRAHTALQQLDVMLIVGLVRVEFYRLDPDGRLRHLWNFGIPFPSLGEIREHRAAWAGSTRGPMDITPSPTELLQMIDQRQRSVFESSLPSFDVRSSAPQVVDAWKWQLQVLDDAARTHARGGIVDERLLAEAASALRAAEATAERSLPPAHDKRIRAGEALLHVSVKEDTAWFSSSVVFRTPDGVLDGAVTPLDTLDDQDHPETDGSWSDSLTQLLDPLRELLSKGVTELVISAGLGAYSLPLHDAALRLGFRTATYAHALRLLHENRQPMVTGAALILGHPGEGSQYIAAADAELNIVASLTGSPRVSTGWRTAWPEVVHIAGHGIAGGREHETGILLANEDFLSAPAILRDVNAEGTAIAFLSACSTGTGRFDVGRSARAVPLDVALLEKGCRTVISTSAPVNDHVALIFATAFHHARSLGAGNWDAYLAARACFEARGPGVTRGVQELLDANFPRGRFPASSGQNQDWRLFRFSGDR